MALSELAYALAALSLPLATFGMIIFGLIHWNNQSDVDGPNKKKSGDSAAA